MPVKKRFSQGNLNFRSFSENVDLKGIGTKPTSEPTSIKEIFMLMVLYACKKLLFFNTNLKIALYLGSLFLISLIADVVTVPKVYLSRSDNVLNKIFVKFAWGWNLILLVPFVVFTSWTYCCGQKQIILKHHLLRIGIATFFWWFWTTFFNYIEASFGKCSSFNYNTKETCLQAGYVWNGFDLSGHSFILIYSNLCIIEETRCIINWDTIKEHIRLEIYNRNTKQCIIQPSPLCYLKESELSILKYCYEKYTLYIRSLFIIIAVFQIMWDIMLLSTILYHHIMIEKFLGGLVAVLTWFLTYRMWFSHPKILPHLPGEGSFKYIRNKTNSTNQSLKPTSRRQYGNLNEN